jgi:hypothetical protein
MVWIGERTYLLRPDGAVDVWLPAQQRTQRVYLEWDRGTMRGADTDEKCWTYGAYYASLRRSNTDFLDLPVVVIVVNSPTREATVWRALERALHELGDPPARFFTSQASLTEDFGPWGRIWRCAPDSEREMLEQALHR